VPKLTARLADALEADPDRDVFLWDTGAGAVTGFGLRAFPTGRKSWLLQYRFGGRTRRIVIGPFPGVKAEEARQRATDLRGRIARGEDPAASRDDARKDLTVAELCALWLREGCIDLKPSSVDAYSRNVANHVVPLIGPIRLAKLRRADVEWMQLAVAEGATRADRRGKPRARIVVRGGKGAAARTVACLRAALNWAQRRDLVASNPAEVKTYKTGTVERLLTTAELARLGAALAEAESRHPRAVDALRVLLLTGARKQEVLRLKWDEVDFACAALRLPDSKTGRKVIALPPPAAAVLARQPRIEGVPWVFPGLGRKGPLVGLQGPWESIRAAAGLSDVRVHDLRHAFASVAVASGESLYITGKLLGHVRPETTARYAHLADDPVQAAAGRVAGKIADALAGEQQLSQLRQAPLSGV
jgi:integrase